MSTVYSLRPLQSCWVVFPALAHYDLFLRPLGPRVVFPARVGVVARAAQLRPPGAAVGAVPHRRFFLPRSEDLVQANHRAAGRDRFGDHGLGPHGGPLPNADVPQNGRAGANGDSVADLRVPQAGGLQKASKMKNKN